MALNLVLVACSLPVAAWTTYLAVLALLSRGRGHPPDAAGTPSKFDVVVPAHNEANGIAATVKDLLSVDYPSAMRRVLVVADNCSDDTASVAAVAGATVLERNDTSRRGKGYALAHAFERSMSEGSADAIVVVDADTKVTPNLLRASDVRRLGRARPVQAEHAL